MKKSILLLAVFFVFGFKPVDKTLSKQERDFAMRYMEQTRDALVKETGILNL
jgi:hypothetical protein